MNAERSATEENESVSGPPRSTDRVPSLDGVRGIAIALVMLFHFDGIVGLEPQWFFESVVRATAGAGWAGVDLFFVLSGFLITGILYDSRAEAGQYFRNFYARRALRIFPLYYGFLLLLLILLPLIGESDAQRALGRNMAWYGTYLTNLRDAIQLGVGADFRFVGHIWSLAVEEQFYLVWPAYVLLFSRRTLMWVCGAGVLCALALRVSLAVADLPQALGIELRVDALAVGAFIALAARGPNGLDALRRAAAPVAAASGFIVVTIGLLNGGFSLFALWVRTLGLTVLAILFGTFLITAIHLQPGTLVHGILTHSAMRWLGRYSYAAYLFHLPIGTWLAGNTDIVAAVPTVFGSALPGELVFVIAAGAMSLAAAWLSWHVWESQFLKLKRFFPYPGRASLSAPPA